MKLFPLAADRIPAAAAWLSERGYRDIVPVSHSLGSRMANAYVDAAAKPAYRRWAALFLGGAFSPGFAQNEPVPVLDVQGDADLRGVPGNARRRANGGPRPPRGDGS